MLASKIGYVALCQPLIRQYVKEYIQLIHPEIEWIDWSYDANIRDDLMPQCRYPTPLRFSLLVQVITTDRQPAFVLIHWALDAEPDPVIVLRIRAHARSIHARTQRRLHCGLLLGCYPHLISKVMQQFHDYEQHTVLNTWSADHLLCIKPSDDSPTFLRLLITFMQAGLYESISTEAHAQFKAFVIAANLPSKESTMLHRLLYLLANPTRFHEIIQAWWKKIEQKAKLTESIELH